jgi:hypothetical protein
MTIFPYADEDKETSPKPQGDNAKALKESQISYIDFKEPFPPGELPARR